jgi:hypothetical protein
MLLGVVHIHIVSEDFIRLSLQKVPLSLVVDKEVQQWMDRALLLEHGQVFVQKLGSEGIWHTIGN